VRWKPVLAGVIVLAAVAAGLGFFWPFGRGPDVLRLPGIVEIQEVRPGSKVAGRVERVWVEEGQTVEAGEPLVTFEVPELRAQRDQLQQKLYAAEADLARIEKGLPAELKSAAASAAAARARARRMEKGWREEEKQKARNELASAEADLKQALEDFERVRRLYQGEKKAATREEFDAAVAARDRAQGRTDAARSYYAMLMRGNREEDIAEANAEAERAEAQQKLLEATRPEDVRAARARVCELKAKLVELDVNLREATVYAPSRVVIEVLGVRKGDIVAPNQPVIRALRAEDLWVRVYVPETELGKVEKGQQVDVTIDAYPGTRFRGQVVQINSMSEFTPRNVQSVDERRHQVFGVKVVIDKPRGHFHAGMAAEVVLPVETAP
jgi:multidrug resistance efflux pump